jgi:hypothetical protein
MKKPAMTAIKIKSFINFGAFGALDVGNSAIAPGGAVIKKPAQAVKNP